MWYEVALELLDYPGKNNNPTEPQAVTATGKRFRTTPIAFWPSISALSRSSGAMHKSSF
jgi:hypothetical protein